MSSRNEQERERLKKEYKEHYQRIKEAKERLKQTEKTSKIQQALNNMNADSILGSVDEFLGKIQDKVIGAEARLDVAMDNLGEDADDIEETKTMSKEQAMEVEEQLRKQRAQEALKQMKLEMGMLYSEIEKQADEIKAHKTIGNNPDESASDEDESTDKT